MTKLKLDKEVGGVEMFEYCRVLYCAALSFILSNSSFVNSFSQSVSQSVIKFIPLIE